MRRTAVALVVSVAVLSAAACSSGGGDGDSVQAGGVSGERSEATTTTAPVRDVMPDPDIELTEDTVVVRSEGGRAVKSFSGGDIIVIDADAEGADELDAGEVMLLTGVTVVRAAKIDKVGDELRITGAPVGLPEVIRNGKLTWDDEAVDLSKARLRMWGDDAAAPASGGSNRPAVPGGVMPGGIVPGGKTVPGGDDIPTEDVPSEEEIEDMWGDVNDIMGGGDGGDLFGMGTVDLSGAQLISAAPTTTTTAPPTVERTGKVKVDGVEYSFTYSRSDKDRLDTFKLAVESASGPGQDGVGETKVKGTLETVVKVKNMRHSGDIEIVDGVVKSMDFSVPEITGEIDLEAKFQALSMVASMTSDPLFDLPLSFEIPVVLGGIPFTAGVGIGVQVNLSMAMLDNTLGGKAHILFDGDGGFRYADGAISVFGKRIQDAKDLLDSVKGLAEGPVGLVFTNELPKLTLGLGYDSVKAGVFLSNGYVTSFHILPSPAPCTAANVSYVLASGVVANFFGVDFELGRKAITEKQWNFQFPKDKRCNVG
jgi:hypothetical protein